ncbi:MAG: hypothetical protein K6C68_12800 [Ruminococcus sp.]|nr:hypothetical protein [Ruminococcus sp.]
MSNNSCKKNLGHFSAERQRHKSSELAPPQQFVRYSETVSVERFVKQGDTVYGQRITRHSDGASVLGLPKKK